MDQKIKNFRELNVWKKAIEIVKDTYSLSLNFPKKKTFGLSQQMQRCSVSIPSNIAEGFNRFHNKEFIQFLYIALGSCAELETQLEIAFELNYVHTELKNPLLEKIDHESRMLTNLVKKIRES